MSRIIKRIFLTLLIWVLLVGAAVAGVRYYLLPWQRAENTMPANGMMVLQQLEDGSTQITWPRGVNAQYHVLEIVRRPEGQRAEGKENEQILHSVRIDNETSCILPVMPDNEVLTIRVRSVQTYTFPFEKTPRQRFGEADMEITGVFSAPAVKNLCWEVDAEENTVDIQFSLPQNSTCQMYYVEADGSRTPFMVLDDRKLTLAFGEDQLLNVPGVGETHTFAFDVFSEGEGYIHNGIESGRLTVVREDFLGTQLRLRALSEGGNSFSFYWNETKGDCYKLQQYDPSRDAWDTVYTAGQSDPRSYTTDHLGRYGSYQFRVVAVGGQTLPGTPFAATPDEIKVTTGASVVYSTIWPVESLNVYTTPDREEIVGTAPAAKAYCVLDVKEGMFRIRYGDGYGWIDSNYCMINLPEMIGDICLYDIVNSYDSLYMAHEYELPTVTGEVIVGYERVRTDENTFLVPLLYPTALKLEQAAFAAMEQGYKLKIYDSFRPRRATQTLYEQAQNLAQEPIPEKTYTGVKLDDLPQLEEGQALTYEMLMTDKGRYTLSYFLANGTSRHNQGVAMDLTITKVWDDRDLKMQTSMHDLSWYSEVSRNNENADILARIMKSAGFASLVSEWWHFQDDEAREMLDPAYLWSGVTPECWVADGHGWRYRNEYGAYLTDCSEHIDGVLYRFDSNGYAHVD